MFMGGDKQGSMWVWVAEGPVATGEWRHLEEAAKKLMRDWKDRHQPLVGPRHASGFGV